MSKQKATETANVQARRGGKTANLTSLDLVEINFEESWIKLHVPDHVLLSGLHFGKILCDLTDVQNGKRPTGRGKGE